MEYYCTESCSSRAGAESYSSSNKSSRRPREKLDVYSSILWRLRELGVEEAWRPGFEDELLAHFRRLPHSYASDMSVEKAEDVLMHKRLLQMAKDPATRPAIEVRRAKHALWVRAHGCPGINSRASSSNQNCGNSVHSNTLSRVDAQGTAPRSRLRPIYEITISTNDKRKFLSQLTSLMSGLGLNIHEAHAFSTEDGYSLDVFVVACSKEQRSLSPEKHVADANRQEQNGLMHMLKHVDVDFWEIDANLLRFEKKLASGSYGDLYKGTYLSQDVAIKVFRSEHINKALQQEFTQEVFILRKIQHRNIVKFIGASMRPPRLCIVTEYMPGGSVFDFLRKQKDVLHLSTVLRFAIDVSKGMHYLHQNDIIHRDLKAANLLMDENNVVKIADFGVAKIQCQSGVMTAETGTYRWMAPEVIGHKPYNHKADVFSFGIVLWELLTGKLPYEELTPLQAAIGVVQKGLRPKITSYTHPALEQLLNICWQLDPSMRPEFSEIVEILNHIAKLTQE
ncbi:hypothetical protein CDL15_Pgr014305 [Punica granatum]|uniref:non-specific serine/threonine protein kinase n=2 Tax=Punica granatum TaxID=22663 RepID=A0A218WEZ4_PUNGR|nr:hypothetical protein CDL15_Pgr014305 [Punica granatum]